MKKLVIVMIISSLSRVIAYSQTFEWEGVWFSTLYEQNNDAEFLVITHAEGLAYIITLFGPEFYDIIPCIGMMNNNRIIVSMGQDGNYLIERISDDPALIWRRGEGSLYDYYSEYRRLSISDETLLRSIFLFPNVQSSR